jgi:predicted RNA binding protein YcfA (HicA-like mRNA interferase family)
MKLPRDLSGNDLIRLLERLGYVVIRRKGSHVRLRRAATDLLGEHPVTIPVHDELRIGTLAAILDDIANHLGISRDELLRLLFG